jgi:hypothetical protein
VNLRFTEGSRQYSPALKVFRAIGGEKARNKPISEPVTDMNITDEKVSIRWRHEGCRIAVESSRDIDQCIEKALLWLNQINEAVPMGTVAATELTTDWILPANGVTFAELESRYRGKTIAIRDGISEGTYDSSIILDAHVDDCVLHHQSGVMDARQLLGQYLAFKPEEVPPLFLFLLVGVTSKKEMEYTGRDMQKMLSTLSTYSVSHADAFNKMWKGVV